MEGNKMFTVSVFPIQRFKEKAIISASECFEINVELFVQFNARNHFSLQKHENSFERIVWRRVETNVACFSCFSLRCMREVLFSRNSQTSTSNPKTSCLRAVHWNGENFQLNRLQITMMFSSARMANNWNKITKSSDKMNGKCVVGGSLSCNMVNQIDSAANETATVLRDDQLSQNKLTRPKMYSSVRY